MSGITVRSAYGKLQKSDKDLRDNFFVTGQPVGSNRRALDTNIIGYAYHMEEGYLDDGLSDDNLIHIPTHGCQEGYIFEILSSENEIKEKAVVINEIVDENYFRLGSILSAPLAAGDYFNILKPVIPKYTEGGEALVEAVNYNYNFLKDGVKTQVTEDTVDPSQNKPLPVKLMGVNGTLQLTTDNLDISSDHEEDSIAIGDGVTLAEIKPLTRELKTSDADVLAKLVEILAAQSTVAKQDDILAAIGLLAKLTDTQPVSAASLPLPTGAATQTTLAALLTELQLKADLSETQPVSAASLPLPTGAATEATLEAARVLLNTISGKDFSTAAKQDLAKAVLDSIATLIGTSNTSLGSIDTKLTATNTKLDSLETALTPELSNHETQVVNSVKTFSKPASARRMIIQNALDSDSPIRFVPAAATPTAVDGFYLGVGQSVSEMSAGSFKAISVDGGNANVTVLWSV